MTARNTLRQHYILEPRVNVSLLRKAFRLYGRMEAQRMGPISGVIPAAQRAKEAGTGYSRTRSAPIRLTREVS